jgi:hypothetical protein
MQQAQSALLELGEMLILGAVAVAQVIALPE